MGFEGIREIPIPTPLPMGHVNVYLIAGEPVTLIDAGPAWDESEDALRHGLRDAGYRMGDVGRILLTHGHVDHYGLAKKVHSVSGAEVFVHAGDRDLVEDFHRAFRERRDFFEDVMRQNGVPDATLAMMEEFFEYILGLGEDTPLAGTFDDGDVLELGCTRLSVVHTPGHSPGSCCFVTPDGVLFSGDTLHKEITPNAVFGSEEGTSAGLSQYIESLNRLARMDVSWVYPGHGEGFADVPGVVGTAMSLYEGRKEVLLAHLKEDDATAFDLMVRLFGTLPLEEIFLGVCEVLGHLEILSEEGLVETEEEGGHVVYSRLR